MKYQALRPHFFSMVGWGGVVGWVGWGWWDGLGVGWWCGCSGVDGGGGGGGGVGVVGLVVVNTRSVEDREGQTPLKTPQSHETRHQAPVMSTESLPDHGYQSNILSKSTPNLSRSSQSPPRTLPSNVPGVAAFDTIKITESPQVQSLTPEGRESPPKTLPKSPRSREPQAITCQPPPPMVLCSPSSPQRKTGPHYTSLVSPSVVPTQWPPAYPRSNSLTDSYLPSTLSIDHHAHPQLLNLEPQEWDGDGFPEYRPGNPPGRLRSGSEPSSGSFNSPCAPDAIRRNEEDV